MSPSPLPSQVKSSQAVKQQSSFPFPPPPNIHVRGLWKTPLAGIPPLALSTHTYPNTRPGNNGMPWRPQLLFTSCFIDEKHAGLAFDCSRASAWRRAGGALRESHQLDNSWRQFYDIASVARLMYHKNHTYTYIHIYINIHTKLATLAPEVRRTN